MTEDILLKTGNSFFPENLYQQCVLLKNPKVFYVGMQDQALSMVLFQHQGYYIRGLRRFFTIEINILLDLISGKLSLPSLEKMTSEYEAEKAEFNVLNDVASRVRSQGRYVNRLADLTGAVKNGDQCGKFKKCK